MNKNIANVVMASQPWAGLEHFALKLETGRLFAALDGIDQFGERLTKITSRIQTQLTALTPAIEKYLKHEERCKRLERAGWLPHPASPWHLLNDESLDDDSLNEAVEAYYAQNWQVVKASIERAIDGYAIDDEAKATFRDALAAHEIGLYRCVPRTLFPEIERVSRAELHDGAMDKIASQPKLQEAMGNLCPSDLARDGISGLRLYRKLVEHLYASMPTPERVAAIAAEPVPNRHAAVHGYVPYNTARHSVNALIIAEYLFHAILVIASIERETVQSEAA